MNGVRAPVLQAYVRPLTKGVRREGSSTNGRPQPNESVAGRTGGGGITSTGTVTVAVPVPQPTAPGRRVATKRAVNVPPVA